MVAVAAECKKQWKVLLD